ncbi:MAG: TlpA disulfide reductase family protein [Porticoccus sp.]
MIRLIGYSALLLIVGFVVLYELFAAKNQPGETRIVDEAKLNQLFTPPGVPVLLSEISFKDGEGQSLILDDFKGKYVLLNIWATWCVPCREEMPALDHLQEKIPLCQDSCHPLKSTIN